MPIACEIHFDHNRNIVHTGKQFCITVRLKLTEETDIHDIFIQLCGATHLSFMKDLMDDDFKEEGPYMAYDNFLNIEKYLVHGNNGEIQHMMPGTYDYSFQCTLPNNLPSSFTTTVFGMVCTEYTAQVTINILRRPERIFKNKFIVHKSLDLNDFPSLQRPFTSQTEVTVELDRGVESRDENRPLDNIYAGGPFKFLARIDSGGYVPGQHIKVDCDIDNNDPHYAIQYFRVKFNQKVIFSKSENRKFPETVSKVLDESTIRKDCQQGQSTTVTFCVQVPETLPTDTDGILIKIEYEIQIIGWMGYGQKKHPTISIPVVIGTKPILSDGPTVENFPEGGRISPSMSSLLAEPSNAHPTTQLDDDTVSIRTYTSTPPAFPDDDFDLPTYNEAMLSNMDDFNINLDRMQNSFAQLYRDQ